MRDTILYVFPTSPVNSQVALDSVVEGAIHEKVQSVFISLVSTNDTVIVIIRQPPMSSDKHVFGV